MEKEPKHALHNRIICAFVVRILHWKIPSAIVFMVPWKQSSRPLFRAKHGNDRTSKRWTIPIFALYTQFSDGSFILHLSSSCWLVRHSIVCVRERHLQPTGTSLTRRFAAMNNERLSNGLLFMFTFYMEMFQGRETRMRTKKKQQQEKKSGERKSEY